MIESTRSYTRHTVLFPVVIHRSRDVDGVGISVSVFFVIISRGTIGHCRSLRGQVKIVIDAFNLGIIGPATIGRSIRMKKDSTFCIVIIDN